MKYILAYLALFAIMTGNIFVGIILFIIASGIHKNDS